MGAQWAFLGLGRSFLACCLVEVGWHCSAGGVLGLYPVCTHTVLPGHETCPTWDKGVPGLRRAETSCGDQIPSATLAMPASLPQFPLWRVGWLCRHVAMSDHKGDLQNHSRRMFTNQSNGPEQKMSCSHSCPSAPHVMTLSPALERGLHPGAAGCRLTPDLSPIPLLSPS